MVGQLRGVALDPKNKSVIITEKRLDAVLAYFFPEIFQFSPPGQAARLKGPLPRRY